MLWQSDSWEDAGLDQQCWGNSAVIDALNCAAGETEWYSLAGNVWTVLTRLRKEGDKLKALDLSNKSVAGWNLVVVKCFLRPGRNGSSTWFSFCDNSHSCDCVITVVTSVSPAILHYGLGIMKNKCRRLGLCSLWLNCRMSLWVCLECPSSDCKSPAVLCPLFLTKLFVMFPDTKHFSLFLLSLTNYSLFVLQGRWWKKSVLATSSVVIILFLLSPIPDCKAIHQLFLVTEAFCPWLCLQHSICLSVWCPLMCALSPAHGAVWGCSCSPVGADRASPSLELCSLTRAHQGHFSLEFLQLCSEQLLPLGFDGACHISDGSCCRHSLKRLRVSHQRSPECLPKQEMFRKACVYTCHLRLF